MQNLPRMIGKLLHPLSKARPQTCQDLGEWIAKKMSLSRAMALWRAPLPAPLGKDDLSPLPRASQGRLHWGNLELHVFQIVGSHRGLMSDLHMDKTKADVRLGSDSCFWKLEVVKSWQIAVWQTSESADEFRLTSISRVCQGKQCEAFPVGLTMDYNGIKLVGNHLRIYPKVIFRGNRS